MLRRLAAFLLVTADRAFAQQPPPVPCGSLPGCGGGSASNLIAERVLPNIAQIMLRVTGGAAVAFIVWAGIQMAISKGDESKISTARNAVINVIWGLGFALGAQMAVSFAVTEPSIAGITNEVTAIAAVVSVMLTVFNAIFVLAIVYAGTQMVLGYGKEDVMTTQKRTITWAIVGAVIVNVANAIVHIVTSYAGG